MYTQPPYFLICLIWLMTMISSLAQTNQALEFIKLRHEPSELARSEVKDILQDRFGFIWFATTKGLIRYDGHNLKTYRENPLNPYGIGSNFLNKLVEDDSGNLWIGSGEGELYQYLQEKDAFLHVPFSSEDISSGVINDLLIDQKKRLWCATSGGLQYVDQIKGERKFYFKETSVLSTVKINCLYEDAQGRIWLGTQDAGLYLFHPDSHQVEKYLGDSNTEVHATILDITATPDGRIWFSTEAPALHALDTGSMKLHTVSLPEIEAKGNSGFLQEMISDQDGSLWLATWGNGLIHLIPETQQINHYIHNPSEPYSISSSMVGALYFDAQSTLWVGLGGDGVDQLFNIDDKGFELLPLKGSNPEPNFYPNYRCMLEDSRGVIWAGTLGNGLYRYDLKTKSLTHFLHQADNPQSPAHDMIWDLMEDKDGFIWIATHDGLQRLDPETLTFNTYRSESGLVAPPIRSLHQDHLGRIWIGTFAGLHLMDVGTEKIQFIDTYFDQPNFIVLDILEDSKNQLWVSSFGKGLYRLDIATKQVEHFLNTKGDLGSLSSNIVLDIREDEQQNLWFATQGGGLCQFALNNTQAGASLFTHWRSYNSDLPDDDVFGLAVGEDNKIWLATDAGLHSFDPQSQQIYAYTPPGRRKVLRFVENGGTTEVFYAASGKEIYQLQPDSLFRNTSAPSVYVTNIHINGKPLSMQTTEEYHETDPLSLYQSVLFTENFSLNYKQNDLTFEFSALNFIQSEKNQYKFKLEGYQEEWIESDARNRRISYTNLTPGHYQFRVIASNNDGVWNETGKLITIDIAPPWWGTWWAYLGYALLAFLLIRTLYAMQLRRRLAQAEAERLKELNTAKTRLYTNVTHEFRTPLTVILGMAQQIKTEPSAWLEEGVDAITRNGRQLLTLVNQMMDLSRLETSSISATYQQGDVMAYLGYLVQSFHSYASVRQVDLQLIRKPEYLEMDFEPDLLAKVMNNLLSNALKFTPEGREVKVYLEKSGDQLSIRVYDNGMGIPAEYLPRIFDRFFQVENAQVRGTESTGIGLALVRELVDSMEGKITVSSEPGVSTVFQVLLPIRNKAPKWSGTIEAYDAVLEEGLPLSLSQSEKNAEMPLVLIIEDNADVARYTAGCLQKEYRIALAENGRIGIEKALEMTPDMILCDVMMPEMDGYQVCETLKKEEKTSHIPIIMLTAKADAPSRIEGLRHGADAYLIKPFNQEELEVRMGKLLEIRRRLREKYMAWPTKTISTGDQFPREDKFLQKLTATIHANLDNENFGILDLCQALNTSRPQLHRKLKALVGRSTSHVIRSIRLQHARKLVLQTELNISQIAYQCGFKQHSYFTTLFTEEFGVSPTQMRENKGLKQ